jgi:hypothetical protein
MWLRISEFYPFYYTHKRTCITRLHDESGTSVFFEAGIYDSNWSAYEVLNKYRFPLLFPFLDLNDPACVGTVVEKVLEIVLSFDAYLYYGVPFINPLFDRFCEWVSTDLAADLRDPLLTQLERIARDAKDTDLPPKLKKSLELLSLLRHSIFVYQPYNFILEMRRHLQTLKESATTNEAPKIELYLSRLAKMGYI